MTKTISISQNTGLNQALGLLNLEKVDRILCQFLFFSLSEKYKLLEKYNNQHV